MKAVEIFETIQGEGPTSGAVTTFIRFAGCSLKCVSCDSKYAQETSNLPEVGVPFIIEKVLDINPQPRFICITGGEPLEQSTSDLESLLAILSTWHGSRGLKKVSIETNGSKNIEFLLHKPYSQMLQIILDYKLDDASGKKSNQMLISNFLQLRTVDALKFVCGSKNDINQAFSFLDYLQSEHKEGLVVYFHALGGKPENWLASEILNRTEYNKTFDIRIGLQLHKCLKVR